MTSIAVSGCFDFTAKSTVDAKGKISGDAEIAISAQLAGMAAALGSDPSKADPLKQCEEAPAPDMLPSGIRLKRGVRGTRGDMLTCVVHFEIDDPVAAAAGWKFNDLPDDGPLTVPTFSFTKLNDTSYRLTATLVPKGSGKDDMKDNPFAAMFVAAMANHYLSLSISALRIENASGEVDDGGKRVTWKLPLTMMLNPAPGYKLEMRADIAYADDSWVSKIKRFVGLEPETAPPAPNVASTPKLDLAEQKRQLNEKIATAEGQLSAAKVELEQASAEVDAAGKRIDDQRAILSKIEISGSRFELRDERFGGPKPIIAFALTNNSPTAIAKIYLEGTLQTPGRSVPWLKDDFSHDISGGVEPGEGKTFSLAPNQFGPWGQIGKEETAGAVLSLRLLKFVDAAGNTVGESKEGVDTLQKARERMDSSQEKIGKLNAQLLELKAK